MGRGVRVQRYPGRIKLLTQQELRYEFEDFDLLEQNLRFGLAWFLDVGWIGYDWPAGTPLAATGLGVAGDPTRLSMGAGMSLRFAWNRTFVMRLDVAVSPDENYVPGIYSGPHHPY